MTKGAINAILFGGMLIWLGMRPSVMAALIEGLENIRHLFSPHPIRAQTSLPQATGVWLVAGGGVMVIAGLLALLAN
jgi:hypothetical protein